MPWGTSTDNRTPADFDGDDKADIAVWRPDAPDVAAFYILQSSNATVRSERFGQTGDQTVVVGDWDGDGKDTTGVFRPSNGVIFLKNQNSTGYADIAINYGMGGDKPVTGLQEEARRVRYQLLAAAARGAGAPYVLSQISGIYQDFPDFIANQHTIETAADAEAYLARLEGFAAAMDQENERVRRDVERIRAHRLVVAGDRLGDRPEVVQRELRGRTSLAVDRDLSKVECGWAHDETVRRGGIPGVAGRVPRGERRARGDDHR